MVNKSRKDIEKRLKEIDKILNEYRNDIREHQMAIRNLNNQISVFSRERYMLINELSGIEREEHYQSLLSKHGLIDSHKYRKLYSKAWDEGHACGFNEVEDEFNELLELISDVV